MSSSKKDLIYWLIFVWPCFCIGQPQFESGYYISIDKDTVSGLIDIRGGSHNFKNCHFKKDETSDSRIFLPHEITAYRLNNGKYFQSKKIRIDGQTRHVFVATLVDGIADLFFFKDQNRNFYIIENEKEGIIELQEDDFRKLQKRIEYDPYLHIRKLKAAFADCYEIQSSIDRADFTHKSLIDVTKRYHDITCEEYECITFSGETKTIDIYLSPTFGMIWSHLSFNNEFFGHLDFEANRNYNFGLQIDASMVFINPQIRLQGNLIIGENDYVGRLLDVYQINIKNRRFQGALLLKYRFETSSFKPSLGFGVHGDILRDFDITIPTNNVDVVPSRLTGLEAFPMPARHFGLVGQVGLSTNTLLRRDIFATLRITSTLGDGYSFYNYVATNIFSYNFSVGFTLNKVR